MYDMHEKAAASLKALALICSLKASLHESSSEKMARQLLDELENHGVKSDVIRVVDHDVKPGVEKDMGDGDAWPAIRQKMLESDILLIATPTWLGHMSSVAQRVLERLDAELSETDKQGRLLTYGKVAMVAVVGNEDGAHHVCAELYQALNDTGFTIAATAGTYWNDMVGGEMRNFADLDETPEMVRKTMRLSASNAAHLARRLKAEPYPPLG
jgi:multimeric flavodoxin WrbA